jgi:hypothetical protein
MLIALFAHPVGSLACIRSRTPSGGLPGPPGRKYILSHRLTKGSSGSPFIRVGEAGGQLAVGLAWRKVSSVLSNRPYLTISTPGPCAKSVKSAGSALKASDDPDEEQLFRALWDDETQREVVLDSLKADCEIRMGPMGLPPRYLPARPSTRLWLLPQLRVKYHTFWVAIVLPAR